MAAAADPAVVVLATEREPGERLVVTGRVLSKDGAPVPGARVLAYHTDASGLYTPGARDDPRQARLAAVREPDLLFCGRRRHRAQHVAQQLARLHGGEL